MGSSNLCGTICIWRTWLLKDRKATSYPGCLDGIPVGEYTEEPVAVDGNVVTSRG